jgi:CBS domain-containing protein
MTVGVPTCKINTPVVDVARFLVENNVEEMVVLGEEGDGVGICGYKELVNSYQRDDVRELTVEDIMTEGVPELPSDITLTLAAQLMRDKAVSV